MQPNLKGMHCLKQATRLAYDDLVGHLAKYIYVPDNVYNQREKQIQTQCSNNNNL